MWQYCWAHSIYHLIRWFPKNNRVKARVVLLLFAAGILFPEVYILLQPSSVRFCGQPLMGALLATIVFTFFMIGFSFLFSIMDPVPWQVKLAFHVFGGLSFVLGLLLITFISLAEECKNNTLELYYFSLSIAVFSGLCIFYFLLLVPFWLANRVCHNSILDMNYRTGVCYEPVKCCSCVWHI